MEPRSAPTVLVVDIDEESLERHATILREAGYAVTVASTFADARAELRRDPPDVLVTDIRLRSHNGLQLVFTAFQLKRAVATLVTHVVVDPVLQMEAARLGATYLQKPLDRVTLSDAVSTTLARVRPLQQPRAFRQWPRKQPAALDVGVGEGIGRVRNVGYGGLSFEISPGRGGATRELPPVVDLDVPGIPAPVRVAVVWGRPTADARVFGVRIDEADRPATQAWRAFVDQIA